MTYKNKGIEYNPDEPEHILKEKSEGESEEHRKAREEADLEEVRQRKTAAERKESEDRLAIKLAEGGIVGLKGLAEKEADLVRRKEELEDEYIKKRTDNEITAEANRIQVEVNEAQRQVNEVGASEVAEGKRQNADDAEQGKRELLAKVNILDQRGKEYQKKWDTEDARRQQIHKTNLSTVDELFRLVYNAHPQDINSLVRETIIVQLERLAGFFGLKPQFDTKNSYIPMSQSFGLNPDVEKKYANIPLEVRYNSMGFQVKAEGRGKPYVPTEADMPKSIRKSYLQCLAVYNYLNKKEPQYGRDFCEMTYKTLKDLDKLIRGKTDDELTVKEGKILGYFDHMHKAITLAEETYEDAKGDWAYMSNWLGNRAKELEDWLGVGGL